MGIFFLGLVIAILIGGFLSLVSNLSEGFRGPFRLSEFFMMMVIVCVISSGFFYAIKAYALTSTEMLSGEVTDKYTRNESCTHCRTVCDSRDEDGSCTRSHRECSHSYDKKWYVETNYGSRISIFSPGQGLSEPSVWDSIHKGDYASSPNLFTNHQKADIDANFPVIESDEEKWNKYVPPHPTNVHYNYLKVYRIFAVGFDGDEKPPNGFSNQDINGEKFVSNWQLNDLWAEKHKVLGPQKEANVNIIIVNANKITNPAFATLVIGVWQGGGKNDVNVFIGIDPDTQEIRWTRTNFGITGGGNEKLKNSIRDDLAQIGTFEDQEAVLQIIYTDVFNLFKRQEMSKRSYQSLNFQPNWWQTTCYFSLVFLISLVVGLWLFVKDPIPLPF